MSPDVSRRHFLTGSAAVLAAALAAQAGPLADLAAAEPSLPPDEDGYDLWLRYRLVDDRRLLHAYRETITHVVVAGDDPILRSAAEELTTAFTALLGRDIPEKSRVIGDGAVVVGTSAAAMIKKSGSVAELADLGDEGYAIRAGEVDGHRALIIASDGARGALYGAFHLLRSVQTHRAVDDFAATESPANRLRLANHWDNMDGTVERGYAGSSIFVWQELPDVQPRYRDYARALASVGLNGTVVNNVNANPDFLSSEMITGLAALADVFRAWGLHLYVSANFASPMVLGALPTADPLDTGVQQWWRSKADEIYAAIPDLGGFLVKADSEGQPGPEAYGRTHAEGANTLARAVAPHDGIVMWRAFIHDFDSRTWAFKSYEVFEPLDGKFDDNVVLQIKNGPIDFQVREPVHPLFGALPNTNTMAELQITQEYTGQSTHLCYLVPMWKEFYDFDTRANGTGSTVSSIVGGELGGAAGVINFGSDRDWTRHQLAAANTHGFARLAWRPDLEPEALAEEWVRMTFGSHPRVLTLLSRMLLSSWRTYENYTSPLGSGFMIEGSHFLPNPRGNQAWHQADAEGIGFDRTIATGDGYTDVYHPPVTAMFESLADCPEELLLFLHHVPWGHRLDSGSTVAQHIYDTHFDGYESVLEMRTHWRALKGAIDAERFADTAERFERHVEQARLWRDTLVAYFFDLSRILDADRSWVQVITFDPPALLLGGWPNLLGLNAGNASPDAVDVTVALRQAEGGALPGWTSGSATARVDSRDVVPVDVPVTPPLTPSITQLPLTISAAGLDTLGDSASVVVAPAGVRCHVALDGGTTTSPVLPGYQKLSPAETWEPESGYGWVGDAPESRDRSSLDDLRRDFVNDTTPRTLRIEVPAGTHDVHVLTGDVHDSWPTYVRIDGDVVASSAFQLGGVFTWLDFELDGGADGLTVDIEFSGDPEQHWHLTALVIPDPEADLPPAVIMDAAVDPLLIAGSPHDVTLQVANTTEAELSITGQVEVPEGWTSTAETVAVAAGGVSELQLQVMPGPDPLVARLTTTITVDGEPSDSPRDLLVLSTPAADDLAVAVDAGTGSSPLLGDYTRLTPDDAWADGRDLGWVDGAPMARDRGQPDDLRRDFVNDETPRVLRLRVPAGTHQAHLLVGDATQPSAPTVIKMDGAELAASESLGNGTFAWIACELDGGANGATVDLELSSTQGEHWHLNALLLR